MIVTIFNKKGGTGKTSLAFNLAKDLDFFLLSNDDSVIEDIYPEKARVMDKVEIIESQNIVYDLGGFIDPSISTIFKGSDIVIIPTTLDVNSIKRTINTVMEIHAYTKDIVIVINRVQKAKLYKYKQSIEALKGLGKDIIYIRETEAVPNSIHMGKSFTELYNEGGLSKSHYKGIYEDYTKLLERITK